MNRPAVRWQLPFVLHPRTVRRSADPQLSLFGYLKPQDDYLCSPPRVDGHLERSPERLGDILVWRVPAGESVVDPRLVSGYRKTWQRATPTVLAVVPTQFEDSIQIEGPDALVGLRDDDEGITADQVEHDLAWHLERFWHVEWMDLQEQVRPPVLLVGELGVYILGSAVPPKCRPALAALSVFPLITADEMRAALVHVGGAALSAPELSRVLRYGEESGILRTAPANLVEAYWKERGRSDRRPLRVYVSAAAHLARVDLRDSNAPAACPGWSTLWHLDNAGRPSKEAAELLTNWKQVAVELRERGVRSI